MEFLKKIISANKAFFIGFLLFFASLLILISIYNDAKLFLVVNHHHTPFYDQVFKYLTFLGDGWFFFIAIVVSLLIKYRYTIILSTAFILQTVVVQVLKRLFDAPRPKAYFGCCVELNFVEGVKTYSAHSFPSGHTASVFALFTLLSIFSKNKKHSLIFLLIAIFTGFSRVYLAQHFFNDVAFGSLIGVLSAIITLLIGKMTNLEKFESLNNRLLKNEIQK